MNERVSRRSKIRCTEMFYDNNGVMRGCNALVRIIRNLSKVISPSLHHPVTTWDTNTFPYLLMVFVTAQSECPASRQVGAYIWVYPQFLAWLLALVYEGCTMLGRKNPVILTTPHHVRQLYI